MKLATTKRSSTRSAKGIGRMEEIDDRVCEYFHGKFARAKSKVGGEAPLGQKIDGDDQ